MPTFRKGEHGSLPVSGDHARSHKEIHAHLSDRISPEQFDALVAMRDGLPEKVDEPQPPARKLALLFECETCGHTELMIQGLYLCYGGDFYHPGCCPVDLDDVDIADLVSLGE